MSEQPLHPNLVRLASAYDDIVDRYRRNELTPQQANGKILALQARDDEGVQWSLDPASAEWRWKSRTGELRPGTPPAYGLPSPTPFDISSNHSAFNPDTRINFHVVDESLLHAPSALAGSTRRLASTNHSLAFNNVRSFFSSSKNKAIGAATLLLAVLMIIYVL